MTPSDVALGLIGPIYDAASDPSIWPEVLEKFAEAMRGTATCFSIYDLQARPTGSVSTSVRMDRSFQRDYDQHYHSVNVHVLRLPKLFLGLIAVSHTYCPDEEVLRSEYYNDFLRRHDVFHLMGAVVAQEAS